MNITTTNDDIQKEIEAIEATIPDEELDTSKAIEIEFTGSIHGNDEPVAKDTPKLKVPSDKLEVTEEDQTPTEEVEDTLEPIGFMDQLAGLDVIEDIFDRAGLVMILLGDSAKGLREHDNPFFYSEDIVHVALRDNDKEHFMRIIHGMADAWREVVTYEEGYLTFNKQSPYSKRSVKVIVEYVDQKTYPFFNFPDKRLWQLRDVALPNPYPAYVEEFIAK